MYYAMTIRENIITIHESMAEITTKTFDKNPSYAGLEVLAIKEGQEYQSGADIRCYNKKGKRQPDAWCIEQGYMPMPPNCEIIGGELIKLDAPVEEAPMTIKQMFMEQAAELAEIKTRLKAVETIDTPTEMR